MARIGPYEVLERLGAGGMGEVFLGVAPSGRRVAIKVIRGEFLDDPGFRARFRREVEAARKVGGAFTAPVVNADPDAPEPWFATAYIPAPSLDAVVRAHGPLDPRAVLRLAAGLIEALHDIHAAGLIHRDLKPANILITEHDGPKVIDFGIARDTGRSLLVSTGTVLGTPAYMAPEQIEKGAADYPTDVFAMGSVLSFAATGRLAFPADTPIAALGRIVYGEADPTGVPPELADLIGACLAKAPKDRPSLAALAALVGERLAPAPRPPAHAAPARQNPATEPPFIPTADVATSPRLRVPAPPPRPAGRRRDIPLRPPGPERERRRALLITALTAAVLAGTGTAALSRCTPFSNDGPSTRSSGSRSPDPSPTRSTTPETPTTATTATTPTSATSTPAGGTVPGGGKPAPGGGTWCTPAMIRVQIQPVEVGKSAYNTAQNVALKVVVTNESGPTCYVDLAPSHAYIEVMAGADRLWSSADCATGPGTDVRQIQQGASQAVSITRDWAWTRSDARQCATNGGQTKAIPAGNAAYRAKGVLAGLEPSGEFVFTATVGR